MLIRFLLTSLLVLLPLSAMAKINYFWMSFTFDQNELNGYASIDQDKKGKISGEICLYVDPSTIGNPLPLEFPGALLLEGNIVKNKMKIRFETKDTTKPNHFANKLVSIGTFKLSRSQSQGYYSENILGALLSNGGGWDDANFNDKYQISMNLIPDNIIPLRQDFYLLLNEKRGSLQYSVFDSMSPSQALSFIAKKKVTEAISPSIVRVIYHPSDRAKMRAFIQKYEDIISLQDFDSQLMPDCGSPYVESQLIVRPMLEYYVARKFQTSGLVARAHPDELPLTPPYIEMRLKAQAAVEPVKSEDPDLEKRFAKGEKYFKDELIAYLSARRPGYAWKDNIGAKRSGGNFGYRWEIIGPSISECQRNKWEKFHVVVAYIVGDGPTISINAVDGYEAPGAFDDRPSDERFRENVLGDERLAEIQDNFSVFLRSNGVGLRDRIRDKSVIACKN